MCGCGSAIKYNRSAAQRSLRAATFKQKSVAAPAVNNSLEAANPLVVAQLATVPGKPWLKRWVK